MNVGDPRLRAGRRPSSTNVLNAYSMCERLFHAGSSQCPLRVRRTLLFTVVRWQILAGVTAVGPHPLVLRGAPRVAERLGIQDGTGASSDV